MPPRPKKKSQYADDKLLVEKCAAENVKKRKLPLPPVLVELFRRNTKDEKLEENRRE